MFLLWTLALVAITAGPATTAALPPEPPAERQRSGPTLPEWLSAVEAHEPGAPDAATRTAATWSKARLDQLLPALKKWLALSANESRRNEVRQRGALLHMDTAMILSADPGRAAEPPPSREPGRPGNPPVTGYSIRGSDGEFKGLEQRGVHWQFGRTLLDGLEPKPSLDDTARRWYRAAAAFMANRSEFADLLVHMEKAAALFPDDAEIMYVSGCMYEAFGSPRIRAIVESSALPVGVRVYVPSLRDSWRRAEEFFRRATEARPEFAIAHVRLGRVLHMLGEFDAAARQLRDAGARTNEASTLYLAALFEGGLRETMREEQGARAAYERAAALVPQSQSPYLALSRMARARGERREALAMTERALTRRVTGEHDDPWWAYHLWHVRHEDVLFHELRQPFVNTGESR
jgi:tetratricopeptide (TPR) repeat protein